MTTKERIEVATNLLNWAQQSPIMAWGYLLGQAVERERTKDDNSRKAHNRNLRKW